MAGLSRGFVAALVAAAVVSSGCSSGRTAGPAAPSTEPGKTLGTAGHVIFASEKVGWVVAPHMAQGVTDIYRTTDGGLAWTLWGRLPEVAEGRDAPGTVAVASESALLLVPAGDVMHTDHVMFRADGGRWERRDFPFEPSVYVSVEFLPDMQHGWLLTDNYGDLLQTLDGGRTWKVVTSFRRFESAGTSGPIFWSPTDGSMYYINGGALEFLVTHDSGATWRAVDLPVIHAQQDLHVTADVALSPSLTMFDDADGLLALYVYRSSPPVDPALGQFVYVTATSDGAADWSPAKLVRLPAAGGPVFLDSQRWMMASDRHVYFTHDAGGHWQEGSGLDAGLWRGTPGLQVMQSNRNVVFLTFSASGIEWLDVSADGGEHWKPVPLPDLREPAA